MRFAIDTTSMKSWAFFPAFFAPKRLVD